MNLDVRPIRGAEADTLIRQLYATPPAIVEREFTKEGQ
jgi:hypothetical protein